MKKVFKSRWFICLLVIFFIMSVGVCAVTYFPSNQVTYDNKTSGLKSSDVQGAIDELYIKAQQISNVSDGKVEDMGGTVSSGSGLYKDEYEEGRYIYKGKDSNNYVKFNNEEWRIISVEKDGTIKIMRNTSLGKIAWDDKYIIWTLPASLNLYLNDTYYNGMNSSAKSKIVSGNFGMGPVKSNNDDLGEQVNSENMTRWHGNVALISLSDYIRSNSDMERCGTYSKINSNYGVCQSTTWMSFSLDFWTMNFFSEISPEDVLFIRSNGRIDGYDYGPQMSFVSVFPVVYLSSDITLVGNGTVQSPFIIKD